MIGNNKHYVVRPLGPRGQRYRLNSLHYISYRICGILAWVFLASAGVLVRGKWDITVGPIACPHHFLASMMIGISVFWFVGKITVATLGQVVTEVHYSDKVIQDGVSRATSRDASDGVVAKWINHIGWLILCVIGIIFMFPILIVSLQKRSIDAYLSASILVICIYAIYRIVRNMFSNRK